MVRYSLKHDLFLPVWNYRYTPPDALDKTKKVPWWEVLTHGAIKKASKYPIHTKRNQKDSIKLSKAAEIFNKADFEYFHSDDFLAAQQKYIDWCAEDGVLVNPLMAGKDCGDD